MPAATRCPVVAAGEAGSRWMRAARANPNAATKSATLRPPAAAIANAATAMKPIATSTPGAGSRLTVRVIGS